MNNMVSAIEQNYRSFYRDKKLENIILFRSGPMPESYIPGMDFDDNARALFHYALSIRLNELYELVWLVKDPQEMQEDYRRYRNVQFISYEDAEAEDKKKRDEYYRVLCLAKYIFMTDTYGFAMGSRKDQIRVMLWHGCGFKGRLGQKSCADKYEYMTVTGDEYAKTYAQAFGLRSEQMLVTGYPRVDEIFHPALDWQHRLHIPQAEQYIFWLPTFRNTNTAGLERHNQTKPAGEIGLPLVKNKEQLQILNQELAAKDTILLLKLHPFQNRQLIKGIEGFSHIHIIEQADLLKTGIQLNALLHYAKALISDYSSVAVDYLVLDRATAFTLDDMESYGRERGFFWEDVRKWLPGMEIYDFADFMRFIREVLTGEDSGQEKRHAISRQMQKYRDDKNSDRVLRVLNII